MITNRVRIRKKPKGDTWDVIFADPEVGRVLHANGLIANANKSSIKELATITSLASVFSGNEAITQFPELQYCTGVTSLSWTFYGCTSLTTVGDIIPDGVTDLAHTFRNCSSLTTAPTIPGGVTSLSNTFRGCANTDGIYIIKAVTPPEYYYTLRDANVQAIYVPNWSEHTYKRTSGWKDFSGRIYPISN